MNRPEMVDSVNALILNEHLGVIRNISEGLGIFVRALHKIMHNDITFSKVVGHWDPTDHSKTSTIARKVENIKYGWEELTQPCYMSELVPSDVLLFCPIKIFIMEQIFL